MTLVLYLSFSPLSGWPQQGFFERLYLDKVIHLFMYSVLTFLLLWGYQRRERRRPSQQTAWLLVAACAAVGLIIEILQPVLTRYRTHELPDMLANAAGAALGYLLTLWRPVQMRTGLQ